MTVPITKANISPNQVVFGFSRYADSTVIYYGPKNIITFSTYLRKPYVPTGKEKIMVINKGVEYRPDLVSFDVYGIPDAWWRIMQANRMMDIWDFRSGKTIIIPDLI